MTPTRKKSLLYAGLGALGLGAAVLAALLILGRGKSVAALAADLRGPDAHARHQAAKKLAKLGPAARPALPELTEALKDPDPRVRYYAAKSLAEFGPDAKPAAAALTEALKDANSETRYFLVKALAKLKLDKAPNEAAVPGLTLCLKEADPKTRYYAAKCLKDLGVQAKSAAPALREATRDTDKGVRETALAALKKITPKK
jgi:HEAT repeat protein